MAHAIKPQYLLSDSQLLFAKGERAFLPDCLQEYPDLSKVKAAYIGAANGDVPAYFEIFQAAMQAVGVRQCSMIRGAFQPKDRDILQTADVILLAGGDVALGWEVMTTTGMVEILRERYTAGAHFIGVSAGAVHLALKGWKTDPDGDRVYFETLGMVPLLIDCHDEAADWAGLKRMTLAAKLPVPGIGIPFGSGLVYHPDHSLQPLAQPLVAFESDPTAEGLNRQILYPAQENISVNTLETEQT